MERGWLGCGKQASNQASKYVTLISWEIINEWIKWWSNGITRGNEEMGRSWDSVNHFFLPPQVGYYDSLRRSNPSTERSGPPPSPPPPGPTAPNLGKYRLGLGGVMTIAASLRLLRRMHSPSCTYSPAAWQHQFFSLEGGGACLSVTIYNHRPDPERTGRSPLSTGRSLYSVQNSSIRVHTEYRVQCRVHSTFYYYHWYGTSASWSQRPGEAGDKTPQEKRKKDRHFLSTVWYVSTRGLFTYFDAPVILQEWHVCWRLLPEDSPQKKLSCTDARKVLPHHVPPPLSFFFLHWLV